jgi:hypothetical protein
VGLTQSISSGDVAETAGLQKHSKTPACAQKLHSCAQQQMALDRARACSGL